MIISVVIPTYKNKKILLSNLENNLVYLRECEVIIINDDPQASLKKDLKNFLSPKVILIENRRNLGFSSCINKGISRIKHRYVMLLNDDVVLENENYLKGIKHFEENKRLFAVSFAQKEKNDQIVGRNKISWKRGMFYHFRSTDLSFGYNAWAEGGACILDKEKFEEIGGFDELYNPFYWEDIDLSYRAWKRGYLIIFDPSILVAHQHQTTIKKYFSAETIQKIAFRNQLIFIWKNITDKRLIVEHLLYLPYQTIYFFTKGNKSYFSGLIESLRQINKVLKQRKKEARHIKISDQHLLKLLSNE